MSHTNRQKQRCEGCLKPFYTKDLVEDNGALLCLETCAKQWYALATAPGKDVRVKKELRRQIRIHSMEHLIEDVFAPSQKVEKVRNTKKGTVRRLESERIVPGYLLVLCYWCPDVFHFLLGIEYVDRVLPTNENPTPLTNAEVVRLIQRSEPSVSTEQLQPVVLSFRVGDKVRLSEGAFKGIVGTVESITGPKTDPDIKISGLVWGQEVKIEAKWKAVVKVK